MSATFYCWEPELGLDPGGADFRDRLKALHEGPQSAPSPTLLKFVDALLARYPDLTEVDPDDDNATIWSDGPLQGNIIGNFINFGVIWSAYEAAQPWVRQVAHSHGLHFFDPQEGEFHPVSSA